MDKKAASITTNNKFEKMSPIQCFNINNNSYSPEILSQKRQQLYKNQHHPLKNLVNESLRVVINPHSTVLNPPIKRHHKQQLNNKNFEGQAFEADFLKIKMRGSFANIDTCPISDSLAPLRRSMSSVITTQSRHFSLTENDMDLIKQQSDNLKNFIRCTSAQSSMSLSPSPSNGVLSNFFNNNNNNTIPTSSRSFGGESSKQSLATNHLQPHKHFETPLETEHIQVYLKKNENSIKIHNENKEEIKRTSPIKIKNRSIATIKNSPINQSSSVDSTKEDNLITKFEHALTTSISIVPSSNLDNNQFHHPTKMLLTKNPKFTTNNYNNVVERHYLDKTMRVLSEDLHSNLENLSIQKAPLRHQISISEARSTSPNKSPTLLIQQNNGWHSISDLEAACSATSSSSPPPQDPDNVSNSNKNKFMTNFIRPVTRPSHYLGELVWQVDETVFCGGIEAVLNENLLCRLNIEYIVDLSNQEDDSLLNSRHRSECPCLCSKRTAHSRMIMAIKIRDESELLFNRQNAESSNKSSTVTNAQLKEREEIIRYFEVLIDLIRKARIGQKKVLIHSLKGRNRAPAFVAAYLMHCNRITRVQALNKLSEMISKTRPSVCISDNLQRALMRWQSILGIRSEDTRLDENSLSKMFLVKRNAWS